MRPYDFCGKENNESATKLKQGLVGKITGYGQSMTPILKSGQSVICEPVKDETKLEKKDIVLSKEVNSAEWVPLEKAPSLLREGGIAWQLVRRILNAETD